MAEAFLTTKVNKRRKKRHADVPADPDGTYYIRRPPVLTDEDMPYIVDLQFTSMVILELVESSVLMYRRVLSIDLGTRSQITVERCITIQTNLVLPSLLIQ